MATVPIALRLASLRSSVLNCIVGLGINSEVPLRRQNPLRLLAVLSLHAAPWAMATTQGAPERLVPDSVRCPRCQIVRTVEARLQSTVLEGEIDEMPLGVRRSARGEIWVLSQRIGPRVYDSRGRFTRAIGRTGRGPGEYNAVDDLVWLPGDSVLVVDGINRRATVITSDGRVQRTIQMPATFLNLFVLEWPSRLFGSATMATPAAAGHGLHLADLSGTSARVSRSFSPGEGTLRPSDRTTTYHFISGTPTGDILSSTPHSFAIYSWSPSGHLKSSLVRRGKSLPDKVPDQDVGNPRTPPSPAVSGLMVDEEGLIWFFVRVPAATWRDAWSTLPAGSAEASRQQIGWPKLFNTRIEVIDPARAQLLARTEIPGLVISTLGSGRIAVYGTSVLGEAEVRIDQLRLQRSVVR